MRGRIACFALGALALAGCAPGAAPSPQAPTTAPPNIVLFLVDDLGWRDVGFMGSTFYETPNVDRIAREGMVFTAGYSNAPNCAPTRASLMSGQYSPRHGIYTVGTSARGQSRNRRLVPTVNNETLSLDAVTLAEALKAAGYATASMGKWHLGAPPTHGPEQQGFDLNVGGYTAGAPRSYFSPYRNPQLADGPQGEHLTERLSREAVRWIAQQGDRPFFLYLPFYAVHTPLQGPDSLTRKYGAKAGPAQGKPVYGGMVEAMDHAVGRVLAQLDRMGAAENTIVIFTSDNGGHGNSTDNSPLRGSKGMFYEGGIRVPFAVRWPAAVRAGSRSETPVISMDLYPTLVDAAGAPRPDGWTLDGQSLLPVLRGTGTLAPRSLFWHFPAYLEAYNKEQGVWRATPGSVVRDGDWKLIERFEDGSAELFNLAADPSESTDVSARHPDRTRALRAQLDAWRRSVNAPVPTERNPWYGRDGAPEESQGSEAGS